MPRESYPAYFRLLSGLPIHLVFPSATWMLYIDQISGGGNPFVLDGYCAGGSTWELSERFTWRDDLEDALFKYGIEFLHDRISGTIVRGLIWRRWAEIVPAPYPKTLWRPKAQRDYLLGTPIEFLAQRRPIQVDNSTCADGSPLKIQT